MNKIPQYKQKFEIAYNQSDSATRALFDDPNTRNQAGNLYEVWMESENRRLRYSAGHVNGKKRTKVHAPLSLRAVSPGLDDFLWLCEFLGKGLENSQKKA